MVIKKTKKLIFYVIGYNDTYYTFPSRVGLSKFKPEILNAKKYKSSRTAKEQLEHLGCSNPEYLKAQVLKVETDYRTKIEVIS